MGYDDTELRHRIQEAVSRAFYKKELTIIELVDALFVQLKPLVKEENRAYTVAQLREMLSGLL